MKSERDEPAGFAEFYAVYPKKVGKAAAKRAWERRRPPLDRCLATLEWQRRSLSWAQGYVPNPATWLNEGRWEDEPPKDLRERGYSDREIRGMAAAEEFVNGRKP